MQRVQRDLRIRFLAALTLALAPGVGVAYASGLDASGAATVARLSARYGDTAMRCMDGSAAFHCNGVLLRSTRTWEPNDAQLSRNGLSFSFLRRDLGIRRIWAQTSQGGFIVSWEGRGNGYGLVVRCAFPYDAATDTRPDGCGRVEPEDEFNPPGSSAPCAEQGIASPAAWRWHFDSLIFKNPSCSFGGDARGFELSLEARAYLPEPYDALYNEVFVAAWPRGIGALLPIEAFFYVDEYAASLQSARQMQRMFQQATGRAVPIVKINFTEGLATPFSYDPADQATAGY